MSWPCTMPWEERDVLKGRYISALVFGILIVFITQMLETLVSHTPLTLKWMATLNRALGFLSDLSFCLSSPEVWIWGPGLFRESDKGNCPVTTGCKPIPHPLILPLTPPPPLCCKFSCLLPVSQREKRYRALHRTPHLLYNLAALPSIFLLQWVIPVHRM